MYKIPSTVADLFNEVSALIFICKSDRSYFSYRKRYVAIIILLYSRLVSMADCIYWNAKADTRWHLFFYSSEKPSVISLWRTQVCAASVIPSTKVPLMLCREEHFTILVCHGSMLEVCTIFFFSTVAFSFLHVFLHYYEQDESRSKVLCLHWKTHRRTVRFYGAIIREESKLYLQLPSPRREAYTDF